MSKQKRNNFLAVSAAALAVCASASSIAAPLASAAEKSPTTNFERILSPKGDDYSILPEDQLGSMYYALSPSADSVRATAINGTTYVLGKPGSSHGFVLAAIDSKGNSKPTPIKLKVNAHLNDTASDIAHLSDGSLVTIDDVDGGASIKIFDKGLDKEPSVYPFSLENGSKRIYTTSGAFVSVDKDDNIYVTFTQDHLGSEKHDTFIYKLDKGASEVKKIFQQELGDINVSLYGLMATTGDQIEVFYHNVMNSGSGEIRVSLSKQADGSYKPKVLSEDFRQAVPTSMLNFNGKIYTVSTSKVRTAPEICLSELPVHEAAKDVYCRDYTNAFSEFKINGAASGSLGTPEAQSLVALDDSKISFIYNQHGKTKEDKPFLQNAIVTYDTKTGKAYLDPISQTLHKGNTPAGGYGDIAANSKGQLLLFELLSVIEPDGRLNNEERVDLLKWTGKGSVVLNETDVNAEPEKPAVKPADKPTPKPAAKPADKPAKKDEVKENPDTADNFGQLAAMGSVLAAALLFIMNKLSARR